MAKPYFTFIVGLGIEKLCFSILQPSPLNKKYRFLFEAALRKTKFFYYKN
jgi:hypothetical protein